MKKDVNNKCTKETEYKQKKKINKKMKKNNERKK